MTEKIELFFEELRENESNDILKRISNTKVRRMILDYQKNIDMKYYVVSVYLKKVQERRNLVFLSAIREFLELCESCSLNPVFLKGIFLAADIYSDMNERFCEDIDILVSREEFKECDTLLEKLGYEHEFSTSFERRYKRFCKRHIRYWKEVDGFKVLIELHSAVINPVNLFRNVCDEFILNTRQIEAFGLKPFVLGIEHNLVMLLLHFFKHLPTDYFQKAVTGQETAVNLSNLCDIALFVQKYREAIDWRQVIEIGCRTMAIKYMAITVKYVNELFGELFDRKFISELVKNEGSSWLEIKAEGMGNFLWLMNLHMDAVKDMSLKEIILGKLPASMVLTTEAAENGKRFCLVEGNAIRFQKQYKVGFQYAQIPEADVNIRLSIDEEGLEITYEVENKPCCYLKEPSQMPVSKYRRGESVDILIIKRECVVHRLLTAAEDKRGCFVLCTSNNWKEAVLLTETSAAYEFSEKDNGFVFRYSIPWEFLNVKPKEEVIGFNVAVTLPDPKETADCKMCDMFGKENFWDFRGVNILECKDF